MNATWPFIYTVPRTSNTGRLKERKLQGEIFELDEHETNCSYVAPANTSSNSQQAATELTYLQNATTD